MRWVGRAPRLWRSVIKELEIAQNLTQHNAGLTLYFCVNYGGRAEIADAVQRIAHDVKDGRLRPGSVDEKTIKRYLDERKLVGTVLNVVRPKYKDLSLRSDLWAAIEEYAARDRRYGGAVDVPTS